ncbi:hypothetical protein GCM10017786_44320 [Amycolatopsis deserti]|uniref:Secreted protein n=1 Tax=Amycolatopsis deserti TaxID=185696 RepID=A0ABQ3J9K0_9PSEU|nr:hypothetical protein GCM10017786_44320 [Amycolatopsis deserti]
MLEGVLVVVVVPADVSTVGAATGIDPVPASPAVSDVTTTAVATPAPTPASTTRHFMPRMTST